MEKTNASQKTVDQGLIFKQSLVRTLIVVAILLVGVLLGYWIGNREATLQLAADQALPAPQAAEGIRGELGIDQNINEANIDEYLGRADTVYRDVRMLEDPANWGALEDGDRFLSGYVRGFEVIPLPFLVSFTDAYREQLAGQGVTDLYAGDSLYTLDADGNYVANFAESLDILEAIFPKDKNIFLMCGGGGYAGMTKDLLVALGWDESKIYNVGGYWYYDGANNVEVKTERDGKTVYDFAKVPYYDIDFDILTEVNA